MIKKSYFNNGNTCRVTFRVEPDQDARSVHLVSDVDDWDTSARPLKRRKDGSWSVSLTLKSGEYRFRYLVDGERWINDADADRFVDNSFGETDGVIKV